MFMRKPSPRGQIAMRHQMGVTLLEASVALALASAALTWGAIEINNKRWQDDAQIAGEYLGQFAVGLRGFIADAQKTPANLPTAAQVGVNWLKPASCGGLATNPQSGYVPCAYTGGRYGAAYSTTFTRVAATNAITIKTTFLNTARGVPESRAVLHAQQIASRSMSAKSLPNNGGFFTAFSNAPMALNTPPVAGTDATFYAPGVNAGRVVLVLNNAPSNDIWLRVDGTNQMLANLNMGGNSLANAQDGRFTGRVQIDNGMVVTSGTADLRGSVVTPEVSITSIGKAASQGIYSAEVMQGSTAYTVAKPDCSQAGNLPAIYASLQSTGSVNHAGYLGDSMYDARVDVVDQGASWRVTPIVRGTKFNFNVSGQNIVFSREAVSTSPADARVVVMTRCR